jgi:plastocyanin
MRKRTTGAIALMIASLVAPVASSTTATADERCTPIAHVLDASQIPGNESQNPNGPPDERYKDAAGLNCIPTYELDFAGALNDPNFPKNECEPESRYDQIAKQIWEDPQMRAACKRLKFTMGPLLVRPGMNDSLIHVTTFEHPMYNGYTLRWKPGLQTATGRVPLVQDIHLHHGTWIGGVNGPTAATGPFFATGEEQTILQFPKGYGWSMQGNSAWSMLYMLHNALTTTELVYITYDIDYIATADAQNITWTDTIGNTRTGIQDVRSIWMDAGAGGTQRTWDGKTATTASYSPINPIFNAMRGYGHQDDGAFWGLTGPDGSNLQAPPIRNNFGTGDKVCTFPRENCAAFDSAQKLSTQQGIENPNIIGRPININGTFGSCPTLPANMVAPGNDDKRCSTVIVMGGHLHPGGLRDEVSVRRGNRIVPIHISDAVYWGGDETFSDQEAGGAPATSWDLSMTGTAAISAGDGRARDAWKVLLQPGDELILNGVYDTEDGSSYDQMAIVMAWAVPGFEPDAIDPFAPDVVFDAGWATGPNATPPPPGLPAAIDNACYPGEHTEGELAGKTVLCLRGNVTHGSMPSRQDHYNCETLGECPALTSQRQPLLSNTITMQGFNYGQMDLALAQAVGLPQVPAGTTLTFENPDLAAMVWHTVTVCAAPCTGRTSANYPFAAKGDIIEDFDSTILGVGLGAATLGAGGLGVTSWKYTPTEPGVYTFFCRIHPFMRGGFEVTA